MALTTADHIEIRDLVARYNHAVDSGDGDGYADTFIDTGVLEAGELLVEGRDALAAFAVGLPKSQRAPRHIASNLVVSGDGDHATVAAYVQMYTLVGDPPRQEVAASGRYADQLVRSDGRWLFVRRVFTSDA